MFRAVVFDLDGTLLDTLADLAAACNFALAGLGLPEHFARDYRFMVGDGIPKLVERMLPENRRDADSLRRASELFFEHYNVHMMDTTAPYPGIIDLLEDLRRRGVPLGVVSNKADDAVLSIVERFFPQIFDAVLGLRNGFAAKPDPASTLYLIGQLGARREDVLYVGDSGVDMRTAKNAGIACCGVLWGFRGREELTAAGAEYLADSATELENLILLRE